MCRDQSDTLPFAIEQEGTAETAGRSSLIHQDLIICLFYVFLLSFTQVSSSYVHKITFSEVFFGPLVNYVSK